MTPKEFAKKIIQSINPGTADISGIGDGTIKGAISEQNKKIPNMLYGKVEPVSLGSSGSWAPSRWTIICLNVSNWSIQVQITKSIVL